jgi:predicted permease
MFTVLRHSFRTLLKSPGFTATALAILALCLGANLTIFAVVDALLIRPLPYPHSDRLVTLYYVYPKLPSAAPGASLTNYYERRGRLPALTSLSEIAMNTSVVGEPGATSIENLGRITPDFFDTLAVHPFLGRPFSESEMTYQTDHVAMLSYEYWQSRFGGDPAVLGKTIRMDGIARTIVGVLPPNFRFLSFAAPVYLPLSSEEGERNVGARHSIGKILVGRLAPGATLADIRAQVDALDAQLAPQFPEPKVVADAGCHTIVAPLQADHVAAVRPVLLPLQAGGVLLLVIGAVNLVNLLLIRASSRTRELAIRQALGASHTDVVREVLSETLLLTFAGGVLSLLVGAVGVELLRRLGAERLPLGNRIQLTGGGVGLTLLVALVTGLALGVPVAWFNLRTRLATALQSESRGSTVSRATQRVRHGFIVAQFALAFVLLAGAGLLGVSLQRAMAVSPGFRPDHVITGAFTLTWNGYHDEASFARFFERLLEKAQHLPGVTAFGVASNVPVSGHVDGNAMHVPGYAPPGDKRVLVHNQVAIGGDYFAAMGIPLRAGRYLGEGDVPFDQRNCVVDENFVRNYWRKGDAIGRQVYRNSGPSPGEKPYTIVGIVGTVKQRDLTEKQASGTVYFTYNHLFRRNFSVVARTSLPPEALANSLVKLVREVDPDVPLSDVHTMVGQIDASLAPQWTPALLAGSFAACALLLASIGLYGVMAYSVSQRTAEFGIRMALGATRGVVLRMVLGQGAQLALLGLALGTGGALLLTGYVSAALFDVQANDPRTLLGVALVLCLVAALACWLPARRATRVDPMVVLRAE